MRVFTTVLRLCQQSPPGFVVVLLLETSRSVTVCTDDAGSVLHRRNRCDFNPRQLPDDEDETRRRPAKQGNEAADTLCSDADDREVDSSFPAWKPSLITSY